MSTNGTGTSSTPEHIPKLSFGLPVFNGQRSLGRVIESIQRQTFQDFELVISDNHSTDATAELVARYAEHDARIRFFPQPSNAGLVANFNRAADLARGDYFRWIGCDDWLEPTYAEKCVALLDQHPEAIGVTTYQAHWSDEGQKHYLEYRGPRVDSPLAHERFSVCLQLMHADYRSFDPMYSMHRRRVLSQTRGLCPILNGDQMLAADLSLRGPYVHVPECLANRGVPGATREAVLKLLRPPGYPPLDHRPEQFLVVLNELVQATALTPLQKLICHRAILRYYWKELETARLRPIRAAIALKLRAMGVPVERISPFHRRARRGEPPVDSGLPRS